MTTRQLASLAALPLSASTTLAGGSSSSGMMGDNGGNGSNPNANAAATLQKLYEEKVQKLQSDLTAAYKLHAENAAACLRLKERAERDERALLAKEDELSAKCREVVTLQNLLAAEKESSKERMRQLEATAEHLRKDAASTRIQLKDQEARMETLEKENDTLLAHIMKMKEQQTKEMNEMNEELLRAQAAANQRRLESSAGIGPNQLDPSSADMNSIIDHVAWSSNFNVEIPKERKRTIRAHRSGINSGRYNKAGSLIASAGVDGLVKIYDARSGQPRASLKGSSDSIMNVTFSPNDQMLLASGNDNIARVWSLKYGRVLHTLVGHTHKVFASTFTTDGSRAITGSHDRTVRFWDIAGANGACSRSLRCVSTCNYLSVNQNDNILATAHLDMHVRFWSILSGELMHDLGDLHGGQATSVEFSKDGLLAATASRDHTVKIVDIRTYKTLHVLEGTKNDPYRNLLNWSRAVFSPDDKHVVTGGHTGQLFYWSVETGEIEHITPGVNMEGGIYGNAEATSSPASASASSSSSTMKPLTSTIACVDWNRNGRQVMSCDLGGNIHVFEEEMNIGMGVAMGSMFESSSNSAEHSQNSSSGSGSQSRSSSIA